MTRNLLVCGLLAGALAGLLATGFARIAGEPAVGAAIGFEEARSAAADRPASQSPPQGPQSTPDAPDHAPLVSRGTQSGIGLLTAATVFGLAIGGLFALAFALSYGRFGPAGPRATALLLAAGAFIVVFLVPFLRYPSNPPAVGDPDTIGRRTALHWAMVGISLAAAAAALRVQRLLARRTSPATAWATSVAAFLLVALIAGRAMPAVHEVPADFPAVTLWEFRQATVGMQLVLWAVIGVVFGLLAERVTRRSGAHAGRPGGPGGARRGGLAA